MESGLQIISHDVLALISSGQWQESEDIEDMNNTIDKCELIDIYRVLYPTIENTFFSIVHAGIIWLDHNREGYSKYLNRYHKAQRIKITCGISHTRHENYFDRDQVPKH